MLKPHIVQEIIQQVEAAWGVPINIVEEMETPGAGGQADAERGVVEIEEKGWRSRSQLMSVLIHEVAHILCSREGKYDAFHNYPHPDYLTEAEIMTFLSTAWKAECYVERRAKAMMADLYPGYLFIFGYNKRKLDKAWFDKEFLAEYKKVLRRKKLRRIDRERRRG